jgi:hypothetical protein
MKVIVFGAGHFGKLYAEQEKAAEIVAFADNAPIFRKYKNFLEYKVIPPNEIPQYEFDKVVICVDDDTMNFRLEGAKAMDAIFAQLLSIGVDAIKIGVNNILYRNSRRTVDLYNLSQYLKGIDGCVAECGVLRGHFAAYINMYFQNRPLYLFDTFCGFDSRDTDNENSGIARNWLEDCSHLFDVGSEQIVLARCPFPQNVILIKGYIPETFIKLENKRFAFVNLDMDLYLPTLNALRFFVPRLTYGGVIQVHDYFHPDLPGIKQAVDEFSCEYKFLRIPTGDTVTVALAGFEKH